jgi:hypothetical protein
LPSPNPFVDSSRTVPWAMMLIGFAGLAYGGRRLRRKGLVARSIV